MTAAALCLLICGAGAGPPAFSQMIGLLVQEHIEPGIARTAEFMQEEYGRELGPLFVDVESFVAAGQQVSGPDFDRDDVETAIALPFQDATYEQVVRHAPQGHAPGTVENYWTRDNGFFVRVDSVVPTPAGFDLLVTIATTEYRPADQYRPVASSALSIGQTRYSFAREDDRWVLKGRERVWTS